MSADWIKFEFDTFEKPEVLQMANELGIPEQHVVGCLLAVWGWFNRHTLDGTCNAASVTDVTLDRFTGVTGFSKVMEKVGWLERKDGIVRMPNFHVHNSNCAKKRALTTKRVAAHRSNAASVTSALPEKRRIYNPPNPPTSRKHTPASKIAEDWQPNARSLDWLKSEGLNVGDIRRLVVMFRNYFLETGKKYANWDLAFQRNPVVKAEIAKLKRSGNNGTANAKFSQSEIQAAAKPGETWDQVIRRLQQELQKRGQ